VNSKFAIWVIYLVFAIFPLLFIFSLGRSFNESVNPAFVSGFITANGVFLGFLSALLLSQKLVLDPILERVIAIDLLLFGISLFTVFGNALTSETASVASLFSVVTSLSANLGSVFIIFALTEKGGDRTKKTN